MEWGGGGDVWKRFKNPQQIDRGGGGVSRYTCQTRYKESGLLVKAQRDNGIMLWAYQSKPNAMV